MIVGSKLVDVSKGLGVKLVVGEGELSEDQERYRTWKIESLHSDSSRRLIVYECFE